MLSNDRHVPMVREIPLDRLLTETDGPFTRIDGRPSEPLDVALTIEGLASLHQMSANEIAATVRDNLRILVGEQV